MIKFFKFNKILLKVIGMFDGTNSRLSKFLSVLRILILSVGLLGVIIPCFVHTCIHTDDIVKATSSACIFCGFATVLVSYLFFIRRKQHIFSAIQKLEQLVENSGYWIKIYYNDYLYLPFLQSLNLLNILLQTNKITWLLLIAGIATSKASQEIYLKMSRACEKVNTWFLWYIVLMPGSTLVLFIIALPLINVIRGITDPKDWILLYKMT